MYRGSKTPYKDQGHYQIGGGGDQNNKFARTDQGRGKGVPYAFIMNALLANLLKLLV